jgi:hypothetical protein
MKGADASYGHHPAGGNISSRPWMCARLVDVIGVLARMEVPDAPTHRCPELILC